MSDTPDALASFLDRALADPVVFQELTKDPLGALKAANITISGDDFKRWLGLDNASDHELVEVVRARAARGGELENLDSGCACSCAYPDLSESAELS
jgi:hypothetical protein